MTELLTENLQWEREDSEDSNKGSRTSGRGQEDFLDTHALLVEVQKVLVFFVRLLDGVQDWERLLQGPEGRQGVRHHAQRSRAKTMRTR